LGVFPAQSRDPGLFILYAVVSDPGKLDAVRSALDEAVAGARTATPDAARVAAAVSHLRYNDLLSLATPQEVSEQLARLAGLTGKVDGMDRLHATLKKVTPETVRTAADALLDPRRRTVGVLREKAQ
jgi:predicted Zn-dependent peptidase